VKEPASVGIELPPHVTFPPDYTLTHKRVHDLVQRALDRVPMLEAQPCGSWRCRTWKKCGRGSNPLLPEKTIKRRLTEAEAGARELADDDGPIFLPWPSWSTPHSAPSLNRAISN
jgi:hypothetical protein